MPIAILFSMETPHDRPRESRLAALFSPQGRLRRTSFLGRSVLITASFAGFFWAVEGLVGRPATLVLYPPFLAALYVVAVRRLHDFGKSAPRLLLLAIPVLGPLWLLLEFLFRKGNTGENRFGTDPRTNRRDYMVVPPPAEPRTVNDVTRLNPVTVDRVVAPRSVSELQEAIRSTSGPISVGGGRFSMGGQIASPGSLHLDLRNLNHVLDFSPAKRTIRVQAGIRWCDVQKFVDPHDLSVRIMQSYANMTVGGSLSVNCHGRYVGLGPIILSVRSVSVVLPDGERAELSPTLRPELFYGVIGGYGGLGVIAEAELELTANDRVERHSEKVGVEDYPAHFRRTAWEPVAAAFHNADLYPPDYTRLRSVTWTPTRRPVTQPRRLMRPRSAYPLHRYLMWSVANLPFGKWRREHLIEPLVNLRRVVHWRNYEAGYDTGEVEPSSRTRSTYALQEYFVPVAHFGDFVPRMAEILKRHRVNVLNVSVRHAVADPGSTLAWAREEVFAFVLYHQQGVQGSDREAVGVWTRELIDAALDLGGSYYLPYQVHATSEQFHRAYPRAKELFALKRRIDPDFRLRNAIWDKYYAPSVEVPETEGSEFHAVYATPAGADRFYRFLQNVFHLYPEDRFQMLIKETLAAYSTDEAIYSCLQRELPNIKPFLADLTYAIPALRKQKREMTKQTLELLGGLRQVEGYVEIGTTGRYLSELGKHIRFYGRNILVNDAAPTNSPADILERGRLAKRGEFLPLDNYGPLDPREIADASIDLVTCYIGLHHAPPDRLDGFVRSIARVLRPGGIFILRDHDVRTPDLDVLVRLAHTVFNAGLGIPWAQNQAELRDFAPMQRWIDALAAAGLTASGKRLLQANDPTDNTLMAFVKGAAPVLAVPAAPRPGFLKNASLIALLSLAMVTGAQARQDPPPQVATPADQRRGEEQTLLTFPEWFLVFSPGELADFIRSEAPSEFPYVGHIRQYWQSYRAVTRATQGKYPFNGEYHTMMAVIGASTTIEYGLKSGYETVFGRLTEATRLHGMTAEDHYAAKVARDYVDFIRVDPWYLYDFVGSLKGLWSETDLVGQDLLRKWERKYALTTEYLAKAGYGWVIKKLTQASFDKPVHQTGVVVERPGAGRSFALLPRYEPFTAAAATMAKEGVEFLEVAGNRSVILVSARVPSGWQPSEESTKILFEQPILTKPGEKRVALTLPVAALSTVLRSLSRAPCRIEHVFDY